jgi:cytidylate kinase
VSKRVVTISQTTGAAREDVARAVARRLGFRLVDEEIVAAAAERQGVDSQVVTDVERRRSFMQSLREALDSGDDAEIVAIAYGGMAYAPQQKSSHVRPDFPPVLREVIREVIRETAEEGDVVLASHAASFACAGRADLLRVLVTASPDTRAQRIAQDSDVEEREAVWAVEESDRGRADYLKRFYGVERELPTHYDLVVNTDALTGEQAAELVAAAARA